MTNEKTNYEGSSRTDHMLGESGTLDSLHEVWSDSDFGDSDEGGLLGEGDEVENDLLFKGNEKYSRNIVDGNGVIYKPDIHGKDPPLACGLIFSSRMEFKDAVRTWNIIRGRHFKFIKNNKTRVMAKCAYKNDGEYPCDWMISASRGGNADAPFHVRAFTEAHSCPYQFKNKSVKSGWLARKYSEDFRINPKLGAFNFRKKVMQENTFFISTIQEHKTRSKALTIARGSDASQYGQIHDYALEIERSNPGSTVAIKMTDEPCNQLTGQQRFQRMYVCFHGVKQGFIRSCRPWFGIDGTFLKGPVGGILLTAVGVDPNNGIYPIAYAVVEGENKDSWAWFLGYLKADLGIIDDKLWTIMSDKQKGLIQACDELFPNVEHRFCVKHLHSNWVSAGFRGFTLRKALWRAAKSTTPTQFSQRLSQLYELDVDAGKWLEDKQPREWSRAYFSTQSKCDMLLNNVCESFNSSILDARDQPLLSMFESLKIVLMERMQKNRDKARSKWINASICPRIFKKMEENFLRATMCVPHKTNDKLFEVWCTYGEQYVVNIEEKTCACRKWQLNGIPCIHGISALWAMNKDPMEYVDECYSVAKYLECYDNCILPLNGPHDWQQTGIPAPMPPIYAKSAGRPKKQRRMSKVEVLETKDKKKSVSKKGQISRCTYCYEPRHNRRTCPLRKRNEPGSNNGQENVVGCSKLHNTAPISTANVQSEATNHSFGEEKILDFSQMSYRDKYQLFGLEAPPYALGQPPHLSNTRKSGPVLLNQPSSMSSDGLSQSALNLKFKTEELEKSNVKQLKKNKVTTEQLEKNNAATKQLEKNLPHYSESRSTLNLKVKTEQLEKNKTKQLEKNKVTTEQLEKNKATTKELEKNLSHCSESPISMMSHLSTSIYEKFGLPVPSFLMDKSKNAMK